MDCILDRKEQSREIMQKGYITYSTLSSVENTRSRWADQVSSTSQKHTENVKDMKNGVFYQGIENDPRSTVLPDSKYDLKTLPGYRGIQSQKTLKHKGLEEKPIPVRVAKYIEKMKQLCKAAKERVRVRNEKKSADKPEQDQDDDKVEKKQSKILDRKATGFERKLKEPSDDEDEVEEKKVDAATENKQEDKKDEPVKTEEKKDEVVKVEEKKDEVAKVEDKKDEAVKTEVAKAEEKKDEVVKVEEKKDETVAPAAASTTKDDTK